MATRILISELDSPAQAARFAAHGTHAALAEFTGMLRVGMLVSSTVLVTDAMLLDGEFFITIGPDGLLRELGTTPARFPLVVTGTAATLRDGLRNRIENPAFQWSLPGVDGESGAAASVRHAWDQWLRYEETGVLRYERQTSASAPIRLGGYPDIPSDVVERIRSIGLDQERYRSQAWAMIDQLDLTGEHRDAVRAWWTDAYLRMIAENAEADWVSFDTDTALPLALRPRDVSLPLSLSLLDWARESTAATIGVAWDASGRQRQRLHEKPTWPRMRDLAFAVTRVASAESRRGVLFGSAAKVAIALVVVGLALPGLEIGSIDSPWTWIAFVGAIATTIPFDALLALLGLLQRDPRARLVLHRTETA